MTDGDAARWARMLEKLKHRGDGKLPGLVGFRPVALAHARLDAELDVRPELLAPNGYLHAATVIAGANKLTEVLARHAAAQDAAARAQAH